MTEAGEGSLYLGLPNTLGRNKNAILGYLKDRMSKRIQSWSSKFLSRAGKEVLLKTVVQSLPTFAMSVFLLPRGMCCDMERVMARFWWKSSSQGRGISWRRWDKMTAHKHEGGMGFRSLHDFNIAMLGKQGWRLLTRPNSLVARVYKARYYHDGDFLTAPLGANPSFIWRSIMEASGLLAAGLRRRIGTGTETNILNDAWLPGAEHLRVLRPLINLEGRKVCCLFKENVREWDPDVVYDIFDEEEASIIMGIPLSSDATHDSWFWGKEISGDYSVKTAYRLCRELNHVAPEGNSSGMWRKLWQLKIPPKAKDLMWRAISNILPTRINLRTKHVEVPKECLLCDVYQETTFHCFVGCEFARACWRSIGFCINVVGLVTMWGWFERVITDTTLCELGRVAMICWALWKARNERIWQNRRRTVREVVAFADLSLSQWIVAQGSEGLPSQQPLLPEDGMEQWTSPETNVIKINVDASLFPDEMKYGMGFVARNSQGQLVAALARYWTGVVRPEMAEGIGVKEVLSWLKTQPRFVYIIESDSLVVVRAIRSQVKLLSGFGFVIDDCRSMLEMLSNVELHFVKRSANRAAHCLARHAQLLADRMYKEGFIPPILSAALARDLI